MSYTLSPPSRSIIVTLGEHGDEQHRPQRPDRASDKAQVPTDVKVEPGGKANVKRNRSATHEDADGAADNRAEKAHPNMQDKAERLTMHRDVSIEVERWCARARG